MNIEITKANVEDALAISIVNAFTWKTRYTGIARQRIGGKFYYSPCTIAGGLMILSYLGRIVCRLQALAVGDTGLAKC